MDPIIQLIHRAAQDKEMDLRREMDWRSRNIDTLPNNSGAAESGCITEEKDRRGKVRVSWSNPFNRRPTHEVC